MKSILLNFKLTYFLGERYYKLKGKLGISDNANALLSTHLINEINETYTMKSGLQKIKESLSALKEYCNLNGIQLFATIIPSKYEIYASDWRAFTKSYNIDPNNYDVKLAEQRLSKLLTDNMIFYLPIKYDILAEANKSEKRLYFEIDGHWNKYGIRKAAHFLAYQLADRLVKSAKSSYSREGGSP